MGKLEYLLQRIILEYSQGFSREQGAMGLICQ